MTSFVDRRQEVAEVKRLVLASRLVTLTGVGGTGKTRLAGRVAGELRRAFGDGVWQVDLAGLQDESLLEYAVIDVLGLRSGTDLPPWRLLADYVAECHLLLVLDNCDHLLDACAALLGSLLPRGSGMRVLCTSRQPLGIIGETVWTVPALTVPQVGAPLDRADGAAHAALTLFTERAAAAVPGFALVPDNQHIVVEICGRLDGLPLAIELAAAQLRTLSVAQLADGLADRFRLLSARHAVPVHHRRLRDTFDWSFALCSAQEKALWARLAVFVSSFELDAVTAVCADDELPAEVMLELVAGLVDKSIVTRGETSGRVRYRLLETVREYGLSLLNGHSHLASALRRRHRDWYLHLVENFDAAWFGSAQRQWSARLRAEQDNLRTALGWCLTTPGEAQVGLRMAAALRFYWTGCGGLNEGRYWLDLALATDSAPTAARAAALSAYTRVLITQADHAGVAASAHESLELARRLDDPLLVARATQDLGMHLMMSGEDLPRAQTLLEEALTRYAGIDHHDNASLVMARLSLAMVLLYQGDRQRAEEICAQCHRFCLTHEDQWYRGLVLVGSALAALAGGDPTGAIRYLRESLRLRPAFGDTFGIALTTELLGRATAAAGDPERAARITGAAHRAWRELGRHDFGSKYYRDRAQQAAAQARGEVGEQTYDAAYRQGWDMSPDDAIGYALGTDQVPPPPPAAGADVEPASPLTRRERQVAELIAQGLSDRQIASRLVISHRTAESHTEHILRKLGFTSRTQIAAWLAAPPRQ